MENTASRNTDLKPRMQGKPLLGSAEDLLSRFAASFGEEYRKNLGELAIHPEHAAVVSRLMRDYAPLFEAVEKLKSRQAPAGGEPELDEALFEKLSEHLEQGKRIAMKLLSECRTVPRPFWHVMRENCTYMQMVIDELRKLGAAEEEAALPTLEADGDAPGAASAATLDARLATEKSGTLERASYDIELTRIQKSSAAVAPGRYKSVHRVGYVYVEEFRRFAEPFGLMLDGLAETLTRLKIDGVPEVFVDAAPGRAGRGGKILFGPLFRNGVALVDLAQKLSCDLRHEEAAAALFNPGCRYLKEIHLTMDFIVCRRLAEGKVFTDEILHARRTCIDLLKTLGKLIAAEEIKTT